MLMARNESGKKKNIGIGNHTFEDKHNHKERRDK